MYEDLSQTITQDRFPRWRARLVHDEDAYEPDGDALAPALLVPAHGRPRLATGVYLPAHGEQIVAAWSRLADQDGFCRYLCICHGVTTIALASTADADVVIFDTAEFRRHVGITAPPDLSGERCEWQDVAGRRRLRRDRATPVTGTTAWDDDTTTATSQWRDVDAQWGLFGREHATERARDMLHDRAGG